MLVSVRDFIIFCSILFSLAWVLLCAILSPIVWLIKKLCGIITAVLSVLAWPMADSDLVRVSEEISLTMTFFRIFAGACLAECLLFFLFGLPVLSVVAGGLYIASSALFALIGIRRP